MFSNVTNIGKHWLEASNRQHLPLGLCMTFLKSVIVLQGKGQELQGKLKAKPVESEQTKCSLTQRLEVSDMKETLSRIGTLGL